MESLLSTRGRLVMWHGDGQGYRTPYPHYWIIVSRDEIGWGKSDDEYGRPPLLIVPLNSYVSSEETPIGASDVLVDGTTIPMLFGKPSIVRCGQLRAKLRNKKVAVYNGPPASDELMAAIDSKLVEVLGLEDYVGSLIREALIKHGVNLEGEAQDPSLSAQVDKRT